ncbi:MAG: paraquat-inducible protein A [Pseudomonadales bacterium]|nr:paraquat-inducible protein A [Pseudomonadales bacterium]
MKELERLVACHECAAIYRRTPIPERASAHCLRCGALLYRQIADTLNRTLALNLAALMLWIMANLYPFLGLQVAGVYQENLLLTGGWALYKYGMGELGLVVFLTSVIFPLINIVGMLYLLLGVTMGFVPSQTDRVFQAIKLLEPWSLISVFMLGTLIAIVKLQDLAQVVPGFSLAAFTALLIVYAMARSSFDATTFWQRIEHLRGTGQELTTIDPDSQILHCHICDGLQLQGHNCRRCGVAIHHRVENSIQRTWALLCAAAIMLIPANIYPVMTIKKLGKGQPDTIISGIISLMEAGLYGLGLIVLFASIVVPFAKLVTVGYLLRSVQSGSTWRPRDRTMLYRVTEAIGSWSMVDVFLVALLAGLVSLGILANVTPGIGASFFGAAVILTMFAAQQFDPRLIWDRAPEGEV